jgi:hypothetical protein
MLLERQTRGEQTLAAISSPELPPSSADWPPSSALAAISDISSTSEIFENFDETQERQSQLLEMPGHCDNVCFVSFIFRVPLPANAKFLARIERQRAGKREIQPESQEPGSSGIEGGSSAGLNRSAPFPRAPSDLKSLFLPFWYSANQPIEAQIRCAGPESQRT